MDYKSMKIENIIEWCKANGQVAWLKEIAAKKIPTKDGGTRSISFIEIKVAFAQKFMPEIMPKSKPKQPTMYELIANL